MNATSNLPNLIQTYCKVPEILWFQVFKYCDIKMFIRVRLICTRLKAHADNYTDIFERECLRLFTTDLPLFSEVQYVSNHIPSPVFTVAPEKSATASVDCWKKLLRKGGLILSSWLELDPSVDSSEIPSLKLIRDFMFSVLRDPPLPLPELIRDEFNAYKQTLLQENLYGLIFKEATDTVSVADYPQEYAGLPVYLEKLAKAIPELASKITSKEDKEALICSRWYNFPKSLSGGSSLVKLAHTVLKSIAYFCKVCKQCIMREKMPYELLSEYCKRWFAYCAAMIELDKTLEPIVQAINTAYGALNPELPQYPKFSFTRAMVTLWKSKVYSCISPTLMEAFKLILKTEREGTGKFERKSSDLLQESRIGSDTEATENNDFFGSESPSTTALSKFTQAIADLSINELTIHYLGHSKFKVEGPYKELELLLLRITK